MVARSNNLKSDLDHFLSVMDERVTLDGKCDDCSAEGVTADCESCISSICTKCEAKHAEQGHKVTIKKRHAYCKKHEGRFLMSYCMTCDKPVCYDCLIIDHLYDDTDDLEHNWVVDPRRRRLAEALLESKSRLSWVADLLRREEKVTMAEVTDAYRRAGDRLRQLQTTHTKGGERGLADVARTLAGKRDHVMQQHAAWRAEVVGLRESLTRFTDYLEGVFSADDVYEIVFARHALVVAGVNIEDPPPFPGKYEVPTYIPPDMNLSVSVQTVITYKDYKSPPPSPRRKRKKNTPKLARNKSSKTTA